MSKPEAPEFQIERDYDNRCAHARSMFHMAVQRAETELDLALGVADQIRQAELADLRHNGLCNGCAEFDDGPHEHTEPVTPTIEDVAMLKRDLEQDFRNAFGITRMGDLP